MPLEPCALRSNVKRGCDLRIVANVFEQPANVRKEQFSTQVAVFGEEPIRKVE